MKNYEKYLFKYSKMKISKKTFSLVIEFKERFPIPIKNVLIVSFEKNGIFEASNEINKILKIRKIMLYLI